jgi:hypothetical protein
MTWPNPSVLLVAFAWMCGVWKDRHKQKLVPCRLRDETKVQASLPKSMRFCKDSGHFIVRALLCSTAEHTNGTPRTHESRLVSGFGLEFFWTATSSSISRAIAELKSIVGSKSLSNEIHMAFSRTGMLQRYHYPKRERSSADARPIAWVFFPE